MWVLVWVLVWVAWILGVGTGCVDWGRNVNVGGCVMWFEKEDACVCLRDTQVQ